jgi:hypothetical protein
MLLLKLAITKSAWKAMAEPKRHHKLLKAFLSVCCPQVSYIRKQDQYLFHSTIVSNVMATVNLEQLAKELCVLLRATCAEEDYRIVCLGCDNYRPISDRPPLVYEGELGAPFYLRVRYELDWRSPNRFHESKTDLIKQMEGG